MSLGINTRITNTREQPTPFSRGKTLYVGGSGGDNYTRIQYAIDNASDGDTVYVFENSSPYYENVVVNKSINLIGENKDTTVIDGGEIGVDVVYVSVDNVSTNGFTIQNSGIEYVDCAGIEIHSQNNTIAGNNIISNDNFGIWLWDSNSNTIMGNNISNNHCGIWLNSSNSNTIMGNTISDNYYGITLAYSSSNTVTNNTISGYETGISLGYSSSNTVTNNTISDNHFGIGLGRSNSNTITGNTISSNKMLGIGLGESSNNNAIVGNTISNNGGFGIFLGYIEYPGKDNIIYHNNFINNDFNAKDKCNNIWDDGKYGNYWSDYRFKYPFARRIWSKGIWDTPYEITGGSNKERCPLIKQWPNSKPRTMPRDTASYNSHLLRFLEQFLMLREVLLRLINL